MCKAPSRLNETSIGLLPVFLVFSLVRIWMNVQLKIISTVNKVDSRSRHFLFLNESANFCLWYEFRREKPIALFNSNAQSYLINALALLTCSARLNYRDRVSYRVGFSTQTKAFVLRLLWVIKVYARKNEPKFDKISFTPETKGKISYRLWIVNRSRVSDCGAESCKVVIITRSITPRPSSWWQMEITVPFSSYPYMRCVSILAGLLGVASVVIDLTQVTSAWKNALSRRT